MKAIETLYDGHRFRSRLEARWAVFFNTLEIPYEYEKEGFDLDGTWYLPDFWLPEQKYWVEIKGQDPTHEESVKCDKFVEGINDDKVSFYVFVGSIPFPSQNGITANIASKYAYHQSDDDIGPASKYVESGYGWCICPFCNAIQITKKCSIEYTCGCVYRLLDIDVMYNRFGNAEIEELFLEKIMRFFQWPDHPSLIAAYAYARQARFEHGEKG